VTKDIYLAGGCFWGLQKYLSLLPGVVATESGYANGPAPGPVSYQQVCEGSGHVETVKLTYRPQVAPLRFYLERFFEVIDPLSVNRQGGDVGPQYRTGIYWTDPADQLEVELELAALGRRLGRTPAVESGLLEGYFPAEEYHQDYLDKNPGGYCHIPQVAFARAAAAQPAPAAPGPQPPDPQRLAGLSELQRAVTRDGATEAPFTGEYDQHFEPGIYVDVTSGDPLFVSAQKFDSGCGWPAFAKPVSQAAITELEDTSFGRVRTEVRSAGSGAHLGHVFDDGPAELGGLRYCINSAALEFVPKAEMASRGYGQYLPMLDQLTDPNGPSHS
jgi:peptide methionine sulfoxide reductase msrA/msrB